MIKILKLIDVPGSLKFRIFTRPSLTYFLFFFLWLPFYKIFYYNKKTNQNYAVNNFIISLMKGLLKTDQTKIKVIKATIRGDQVRAATSWHKQMNSRGLLSSFTSLEISKKSDYFIWAEKMIKILRQMYYIKWLKAINVGNANPNSSQRSHYIERRLKNVRKERHIKDQFFFLFILTLKILQRLKVEFKVENFFFFFKLTWYWIQCDSLRRTWAFESIYLNIYLYFNIIIYLLVKLIVE